MTLVNINKQILLALFFIAVSYKTQAQVWTLQQCIDTAQFHNKNLQMLRNNMSASEQKQGEAKANLIPKVTINADYRYYTDLPYQLMPLSTFNPAAPEGQFKEAQFGVPHNINANLQISMPLYSPQIYGAIQTSEVATELTELQYQKSEEQIYFEISNLYFNAQILHHQLAFVDSNLINTQRLLKNVQLLHEQLLVKGTDVSKVKLQITQLTTQKENISGKYTQVLNVLKLTMGIPIDRNIEIDHAIQFQNKGDYTVVATTDIRIVKVQSRLLLTEISTLKKSRYFPSLYLFGTFGTTGFGYDKQPYNFLKFYPIGFVGIQLSYPLFNGTVTQRKLNQKRFELQNNELQLGLFTEQNSVQIENARLQKHIALKSIQSTTEQINLAQAIYVETILQQSQGTASLTDVLLADFALREAQQTYLSAIIEYLRADLELKKLTGNISTTN